MKDRLRPGLAIAIGIEAASGLYLFSFEQPSRWYLGWMLVHLVLGTLLALFLIPTLFSGFNGLLKQRKSSPFAQRKFSSFGMIKPGAFLWVSLAGLAITGVFLGVKGAVGSGQTVFRAHLLFSAIFLLSAGWRALQFAREQAGNTGGFLRVLRKPQFQIPLLLVIALVSSGFVDLGKSDTEQTANKYNFKFGTNPFAPGQVRTASGGFLHANQFPPASYCARCHPGVHGQWKESAHRNSFREPFYKKNVDLFISEYGIEVTRHCESCHNPIALVSGALTTGSTLPRPFDDEGVTCAVCHSIRKVTWLEGVGSYELAPPVQLVAENGDSLPSRINDKMIVLKPELHKKAMMRDLYRTPEFCAVCHKSSLPKQIEDYKWRRAFSTYDEWQVSSHSNESVLPFYKKPRNTCQTCHMLPAEVAWDVAAKGGRVASHRWAAANTAIPTFYGYKTQLEAVEQFLKGRLNVDIFTLQKGPAYPTQQLATDLITLRKGAAGPRVADGFTSIDAINAPLPAPRQSDPPLFAPIDKCEFALDAGETVTIGVVVANTGVGHLFPTELRDFFEPWLEFTVQQADGKVIYHSGFLKKDGQLDEKAHVFQSVQVTRKAEWVRHHNIWDTRGRAYDNFIPPGRSELVRYQFTIPGDTRGSLRITARVLYRRFNRFFSDWVLSRSVDYPVVEMASGSRILQLGVNRPPTTELDDSDKIRFNNLGIAYFDQYLYREARRAFETVSRIDPRYDDAYVNQAIASFRREKFPEMHSLLARALNLNSGNARALYYQAVLQRMEGHALEAANKFLQLSIRYPRDRYVWNQLGECYMALHEPAQARAAFERVLEIDPDDITALYFRAQAYRELGLNDLVAEANNTYLDKFDDWEIDYLAHTYTMIDDDARAEAVPWHVHADVAIGTPKTAGPIYWNSEGAPSLRKKND